MTDTRYSVERYQSREEWLAARHKGIGASDAAAIVGMSTYASAYSVWMEKTEPLRKDDDVDELAYWGLRLEPVIADEFWRKVEL